MCAKVHIWHIVCLFALAGLHSERRYSERAEGNWDANERVAEKRSRPGKTTQTKWWGSVQYTHTLKKQTKKMLTFYSCSNKLMGYIETRMTKKELFYWGVDLFIIAFCQIHFSVK